MGKIRKKKVCTKAEKESHHYQSIFNFQITFNAATTAVAAASGGGNAADITSSLCVCVWRLLPKAHTQSVFG